MGLPGSGKTTLARRLQEILGNAVVTNADEVRTKFKDWDFTLEGRERQMKRMQDYVRKSVAKGNYGIADFVCPTNELREKFMPEYVIWMNTIEEGRFEDTNKVFERPQVADYFVHEQRGDIDAKIIAYEIGQRFIWDNQAPTTQML